MVWQLGLSFASTWARTSCFPADKLELTHLGWLWRPALQVTPSHPDTAGRNRQQQQQQRQQQHLLSPLSAQSKACSRWSPGSARPGRDEAVEGRRGRASPRRSGRSPHLRVALPVEGVGEVEGEALVQQPRGGPSDAGAAARQGRARGRRGAAAAAHPPERGSGARRSRAAGGSEVAFSPGAVGGRVLLSPVRFLKEGLQTKRGISGV